MSRVHDALPVRSRPLIALVVAHTRVLLRDLARTERRLWDRLPTGRRTTHLVVTNLPAAVARGDQDIILEHCRGGPP